MSGENGYHSLHRFPGKYMVLNNTRHRKSETPRAWKFGGRLGSCQLPQCNRPLGPLAPNDYQVINDELIIGLLRFQLSLLRSRGGILSELTISLEENMKMCKTRYNYRFAYYLLLPKNVAAWLRGRKVGKREKPQKKRDRDCVASTYLPYLHKLKLFTANNSNIYVLSPTR